MEAKRITRTAVIIVGIFCLCGGWVFEAAAEPFIVDPNLTACYGFDEITGNTAHDSSGYGRDAEVNCVDGSANWSPDQGLIGGCLVFANDTSVAVPNDVLSGVSNGITIMVWLKINPQEGADNWVFDAGNGEFRMQAAVLTDAGQVLWRAGNDTNDVLTWDVSNVDPNIFGEWYWWAFVKDEEAGTMRIYVRDLIRVRTQSECAAAGKSGVARTLGNIPGGPFILGGLASELYSFAGKMDDFRIFDYAVPDSEMCQDRLELAWNPYPRDEQAEAGYDVVLEWNPGEHAVRHDVYLGTDFVRVRNANTTATLDVYKGRIDSNQYDPGGLELNTNYYWRVDEMNEVQAWKGHVWKFAVANYVTVDDFESYGDTPALNTEWVNNFNLLVNGAYPSLEEDLAYVHTGRKSMRFQYLNDYSLNAAYTKYSETWREYSPIANWTQSDVKILTLFFKGDIYNSLTSYDQLFVSLKDGGGAAADVRYDLANIRDFNDGQWHEWDVPLKDFAGVDCNEIKRISIGFGFRDNMEMGGYGLVWFDDIRLTPRKCMASGFFPDLTGDCIINAKDLMAMCLDWLGSGDGGPDLNGDHRVNFRDLALLMNYWLEDRLWPE
jgi:hypothetical protein